MTGKKIEPSTERRQGFVTRLRAKLNRGKSWLGHDFSNFSTKNVTIKVTLLVIIDAK